MQPRRTVRAKKPGWKPPERLILQLQRKHPSVRLMWVTVRERSGEKRRWGLFQLIAGKLHLIRLLESRNGEFLRPTLDNTVRILDAIDPRRMQSRFAIERFARGLDEADEAAQRAVRNRNRDRVLEGHDRVHHALHRPTRLVLNPRGLR